MTALWPRLAPVAFDNTHRLIPGRYTEDAEHALAALAADNDALNELVQLAAVTNSRIQAQEEHHPAGLGRDDMVFGFPFSKIINGAFANPSPGARFHSAVRRGAWYCALDLDTCLAEILHHRLRMLSEIGVSSEADIPYRLFLADVHAQDVAWLDDDSIETLACLDPDSYVAGQALGARLNADSRAGIVYPSVRHPGGVCVALLAPAIPSNVRREALFQLTIEHGSLEAFSQVKP